LTSYDYGFRIYNPAIARFLSVDPLAPDFASQSPYVYAANSPIKFVDIDGLYAGEKTRSIKSFITVFKTWQVEALKHRNDWGIMKEPENRSLVRVFNHDITARTKDQLVKSIPGSNSFSYYTNFGNDKGGAFIDVGGFPLDLKHFFKNVEVGNTVGEMSGTDFSVDEEYFQLQDPDATKAARTSAFSPEDLVSNQLGLIFSRYDDNGDFAGDLEGLLNEAATLFETNELKGGKYIRNRDVRLLRKLISTYQGTDDFRDLHKDSDVYDSESMRANREYRKNDSQNDFVKKAYLKYIHKHIKN
jgi:hypothetical protein